MNNNGLISTMPALASYRVMRRMWVPLFALFVVAVAGAVILVNRPHAKKQATVTVVPPDSTRLADGRTIRSEKRADSIIAFAETFLGTPYHFTGKCQATGFDCSGFTSFVYGHFGISVSPASKEQVFAGRKIDLKDVAKADLLIFTGTNMSIREPGHVGIVITGKGEPVRFIHSSSSHPGGVMISKLDSTKYAIRFLQARRVLE